jgi:hypothetical protein
MLFTNSQPVSLEIYFVINTTIRSNSVREDIGFKCQQADRSPLTETICDLRTFRDSISNYFTVMLVSKWFVGDEMSITLVASGFPRLCPCTFYPVHCSYTESGQINRNRARVMLRPTVSRPVCLAIKHPSGAYGQISITVRQLRVCWCGAPSLTRGRVCLLQCTIYLHFTCYYMNVYTQYIQGFCQARLSTADHALSLAASAYEF